MCERHCTQIHYRMSYLACYFQLMKEKAIPFCQALTRVVWYCGGFCNCNFKKEYFIKIAFSSDLFNNYIYFFKIMIKIEVE